jgi:integrase
LIVTTGNGKKRRYPRATVESLQDRVCRGINITTSNDYLRAIKGFSRWLHKTERVERDRLVSLSRLNEKTDLRHERRALDETELQVLLVATGKSEGIFEGTDRHMLYAVAMTTGFRAKELANLSPSSFDLETDGRFQAVVRYSGSTISMLTTRIEMAPPPALVCSTLFENRRRCSELIKSCRFGLSCDWLRRTPVCRPLS